MASAAAADAAAFFAEQQREALYAKASQVIALPIIRLLERSMARAIEQGDWHFPPSISLTAIAYAKSWLSAVDARVSRRFLHNTTSSEGRLLEQMQLILGKAAAWFGRPVLQPSELALVEDGLLETTENVLTELGEALARVGECSPSAALNVLLHHIGTRATPGQEELPEALRGSAPITVRMAASPVA